MTESNVDHIEVFEGGADAETAAFFWRAKAANGEIVAQGEGHTRREDAVRAAEGVFPGVPVRRLDA